MGCSNSRKEEPIEELAIVAQESFLKYSKKHCTRVDFCFRKYSSTPMININQWNEIAIDLKLQLQNTLDSPKIEAFYNQFKCEGNMVKAPLLLLGIMLGQGTTLAKAKLIFDIYDTDCEQKLTIGTIRSAIRDMVNLSVVHLPVLAMGTSLEKEVHAYTDKITDLTDRVEKSIVSAIVGDKEDAEIMKQMDFVVFYTKENNARLLTPTGIRSFAFKLSETPVFSYE